MNMDSRPTDGFGKLQFLLQQNPFPPETFGNLLLLYCKYEYFDLAADVLAENAHLTYKYLSPYLYGFLEVGMNNFYFILLTLNLSILKGARWCHYFVIANCTNKFANTVRVHLQ